MWTQPPQIFLKVIFKRIFLFMDNTIKSKNNSLVCNMLTFFNCTFLNFLLIFSNLIFGYNLFFGYEALRTKELYCAFNYLFIINFQIKVIVTWWKSKWNLRKMPKFILLRIHQKSIFTEKYFEFIYRLIRFWDNHIVC